MLLPCGASKENVPIEALYLHRGKKNVKVNRNVIQLELSFYL